MMTYKAVRYLTGHLHDVCGCDFSPDGALLATASYDTSVIVWDPHIGTKLLQLRSVVLCISSSIYYKKYSRSFQTYQQDVSIE